MIRKIVTWPTIDAYLKKHQLEEVFIKAINKIKEGHNAGVDFKKREPKSLGIWSFRINKKYRALCKKFGDILIIEEIYDHQ